MEAIPDTVSHEIQQSAPSVANEVLFLHLRSHSSPETLHKLCDVMTSMSGYPNMNKLGSTMKKDLHSVGCVDESNEYTSYAIAHVCLVIYGILCTVHTVHVTLYLVDRFVHHNHVCMCTCLQSRPVYIYTFIKHVCVCVHKVDKYVHHIHVCLFHVCAK